MLEILEESKNILEKRQGSSAVKLPNSLDEVAKGSATEYFVSTDCNLVASGEETARNISVKGCPDLLTIDFFIKYFFDNRNEIDTITKDVLQTDHLVFASMVVRQDTVEFRGVGNGESYDHTDMMILLDKVKLNSLIIKRDTSSQDLKSISFNLEGKFNELHTVFSSREGAEDIEIKMTIISIELKQFIGNWQIRLSELAENDIGFTANSFETISLENPTIMGVFSKNGSFQLVATSVSKDPDAFTYHGATLYFIISMPAQSSIRSAVLVENPVIVKIEDQLIKNLDYSYSDADFTKKQERPWILSASDSKITLLDNADFRKVLEKVVPENVIEKGINIYMRINMKEALLSCAKHSVKANEVVNGDGIVTIVMQLTVTGINYKLPPSLAGDLETLLKCVDKAATNLPAGLFGEYRWPFDFKEVIYNKETGQKKVVVIYPRTIELFGPVSVKNPEITISKEGTGEAWTFEAKASIKVGPDITASVSVTADTDKSISASLSIPAISVDSIGKAFGADPFGGDVMSLLKDYLNFGIKNLMVDVEKTIGEKGTGKVTITGKPVINGMGNVYLVCYIWVPEAPPNAANARGNIDKKHPPPDAVPVLLRNVARREVSQARPPVLNSSLKPSAPTNQPAKHLKPNNIVINDSTNQPANNFNPTAFNNAKINHASEQSAKRTGEPKVGFAMGIVIRRVRLDRAISRLIGMNISAAWFNDATFAMIGSNAFKNYCSNPAYGDLPQCMSEADLQAKDKEEKKKQREEQAAQNLKDKLERDKKKPASEKEDGEVKDDGKTTTEKMIEEEKKTEKEEEKEETTTEEEPVNPDEEEDDDDMKEGKHFKNIAELKDIPIKRGFTIQATFELPKDCKKDAICKFLLNKIGAGAKIILYGQFVSGDIQISAEVVMNIQITNNIELRNVKLLIQAGKVDNKIEISCTVVILKPFLKLTASIGISLSGTLELGTTMTGMLNKPFGINNLAIGNIILKVGITITAFPAIEMGGTFWIGQITEDTKTNILTPSADTFKFQGYFGFDPTDYTKAYFYARSFGQNITIGNIFKTFSIDLKLPQIVNETGFYDELKFSFNAADADREIADFGISIPPGFAFKGTLLLLNYSISCNTKYDKNTGAFFLDAQFGPMDDWAGGLITIVRSENNRKEGPRFLIDIDRENNKFDVAIQGYINVIGIEASVEIILSDTEMKFNVSGDIWGILKAEVLIHAQYTSMDFSFKACIGFDLTQIAEAVRGALDDAVKASNAAFDSAKTTMMAVAAKVEASTKVVEGWVKSLEGYKDRLEARAEELKRKKENLQDKCNQECGEICIPFLDWNPKCWQVWGYWVGCPSWNSCKWKAPHLVCIAACEMAKAFTKFVIWAEQIGIKVMLGMVEMGKYLLDGAKALIQVGANIIRASTAVIEFAKKVTAGVIEHGGKLLAFLADLIKIDAFCVFGDIKKGVKSCVGIYFDVTFMKVHRHTFNGSICLDLSAYKRLGTELASKEVPDIKDLDKELEKVETDFNVVKKDEEAHEEEQAKSKANIEKETEGDMDVNFERRSHVPTQSEAEYYHLATDPIPAVDLRSPETVVAMRRAVPWEQRKQGASVIRSRISPAPGGVFFPDEVSSNACLQRTNVLARYDTITKGFATLMKSIQQLDNGYNVQKNRYNDDLQRLAHQLDEGFRNNLTIEERHDAVYWKNYAEKHISSYVENTAKTLKSEKRNYVTNFRSQFSQVLRRHRGMTLQKFVSHLHELAINAERRSNIANAKTETSLHDISKSMEFLATDTKSSIADLALHVDRATNLLMSAKRSSIPCAA